MIGKWFVAMIDEGRRIVYGSGEDEFAGATFLPVCPKCGRFVKADPTVRLRVLDSQPEPGVPNADCKQCGRVEMPFEGYP